VAFNNIESALNQTQTGQETLIRNPNPTQPKTQTEKAEPYSKKFSQTHTNQYPNRKNELLSLYFYTVFWGAVYEGKSERKSLFIPADFSAPN